MDGFLRQNTAVDILLGPFNDSTDGDTEENSLTISQADVRLSKNGQNMAQKSDVTACVADETAMYNCELDATDTDTVGILTIVVHEAGALIVKQVYQVMDEKAYDALFAVVSTLIEPADVGLIYESTIGTVTSTTEYIMADNIVSANIYRWLLVTIEDNDTKERHSTWITSVVETTDTIIVDTAPPIAAEVGDTVRVHAIQHPRAAINNYDPQTTTDAATKYGFIRGWFRLFARKDADVAVDAAAELTDLNLDDGAGTTGTYDPTTDSLEAIDVGVNVEKMNNVTVIGAGTSGDKWRA